MPHFLKVDYDPRSIYITNFNSKLCLQLNSATTLFLFSLHVPARPPLFF